MSESFKGGQSIDELVNKYGLKKPTIKKYLKYFLGEDEYEKILKLEFKNEIKESQFGNEVLIKSIREDKEKSEVTNPKQRLNSILSINTLV